MNDADSNVANENNPNNAMDEDYIQNVHNDFDTIEIALQAATASFQEEDEGEDGGEGEDDDEDDDNAPRPQLVSREDSILRIVEMLNSIKTQIERGDSPYLRTYQRLSNTVLNLNTERNGRRFIGVLRLAGILLLF